MSARIIDGKAEAVRLRARVADDVAALKKSHGVTPGLAVVLVGDDPASEVYVRNKATQTREAGMESFEYRLPASLSERALLDLIEELNARDDVNGILVQLPLPPQISADNVINAIRPDKDVDGLHPINAGLLAVGKPGLVPCTPLGCVILAKTVHANLKGLEVVVVGRSSLVGRPAAQLFISESSTVTVAHSQTRDLPAVCRRADILLVAVGRPLMVKGDWVKPGATVIDVGINRVPKDGGGTRLVGDVAFGEAVEVAGAITPVPGGVGPMTIGCLLANTVTSTKRKLGITH
ncbi:MAG TPA: bifunctional methylenetetrahydrofolate dehydrogenase/methenyltetrahydrofolate cyclohydrolase FolD [Alphaproteobacteria bacterium]|nr:bifunctional methylenetetrahydrofolate dehydrogenase/methenyltetrahydrofolate cyclohydrolase FolD [Alphaproteobacteria bacterium]